MKIFGLAATVLAMSSASALAQVSADCKGDYPRLNDAIAPILGCYAYGNLAKADRSTFYSSGLETKRAEMEKNHLCLQSLVEGDIPPAPNIRNSTGDPPVSATHAIENSTPQFRDLPSSLVSGHSAIPKKISYSYVASFSLPDARGFPHFPPDALGLDKQIDDQIRISFDVNFDGQANSLALGYKLLSSPMLFSSMPPLLLMPVPSAPYDLAARQFSDLWERSFMPRECRKPNGIVGTVTYPPEQFCNQNIFGYRMTSPSQEVSFTFDHRPDLHFGSVKLGIYSDHGPFHEDRILSAFWVPVLY